MDFVDAVTTHLCRTLTRGEAERLLAGTELLSTASGSAIIRESAVSEGIYFLFEGKVEVKRKRSDGETARLAVVDAPSLLGELSLVVGGTSTATVSALTDCRLRLLRKGDFHARLVDGDLAAYKLLGAVAEVLARRVLRLNDTLLELTEQAQPSAHVEDRARLRATLFSEWSF
jgi:CRP/FNR family transcriptional regulator, cyclic AMP receptor protein